MRVIEPNFSILERNLLSNKAKSPYMKRWLYLILVFTVSLFHLSSTRPARTQLIDQFSELAIIEMHLYGIPASIKIAQAIVETNWGRSTLALEANNYFGIKCKETWTGPTYMHQDDDKDEKGRIIPSCFRSYSDIQASFRDHSEFLANRKYYRELFSLPPGDYIAWAKGLKKSGYASDPQYAQKLIHLIEQYDLAVFDKVRP
jgi:flagellum-specific peptidoglycan hydrolase FlgJ